MRERVLQVAGDPGAAGGGVDPLDGVDLLAGMLAAEDPEGAAGHRHRRVAHRHRQLPDAGEASPVLGPQHRALGRRAVVPAEDVRCLTDGGGHQIGAWLWQPTYQLCRAAVAETLHVRRRRLRTPAQDEVAAVECHAGRVVHRCCEAAVAGQCARRRIEPEHAARRR